MPELTPTEAPTPVEVVKVAEPIPVKVVGKDPSTGGKPFVQSQLLDPSLPAKTTFQQDLITAGQRRINLIWEYTQASIAIMVVVATMASGFAGMIYNVQIPTIIGVAFGMVTGFYFSRTNHTATGGIGPKPREYSYRDSER